jgi:hypothetical protein
MYGFEWGPHDFDFLVNNEKHFWWPFCEARNSFRQRSNSLVATLKIRYGERSIILKENSNSLFSGLYETRRLCGKD